MRRLTVILEQEGREIPCGTIEGRDYEEACFSYLPAYLEREEACPVSVSLPLQKESFSPERTSAWFSALLPGGYAAGILAGRLRVREEDYLSLLSCLGADLPGALKILDADFPPGRPSRESFTTSDLQSLAGGDDKRLTELLIRSGASLPGQTPACCLGLGPSGKGYFLPCQGEAGTLLVRQSLLPYEDTAVNEALCTKTAEKLGIPVCPARLWGEEDKGLLVLITRADREAEAEGRCLRRHYEDLGQALGIGPSRQYEKNYEGYMASMFRLLRENALHPMEDMQILWDRIVFNFLCGNMLGHIRSFGLVYARDLWTMSLSPAAGLLSTSVYDPLQNSMPFHIDGYYNPDNLTQASFENMAPECGLGRRMAGRRFRALADSFEEALTESARELCDQGFESAIPLAGKILSAGGYAKL